ncbi:MAG TPA: integrase domain-containing protein [Gammaproteobacteria bacterium]|jgi:integrase|nr:integrase domain-containing protein [Gammaproteobacteria bacterium]
MSIKNELQRCVHGILKRNQDGAFETQHARRKVLFKAVADLCANGYKLRHIQGLKQKHVRFLNELWQSRGLAVATIKNRNAHLRWLCEKTGKNNLMPSNEELGTGKRQYSNNQPSGVDLKDVALEKISNKHIYVQIHLQQYLGLRREECIKIRPHLADQGDHLVLQPSWCKGGRGRVIPIVTPEARRWLNEAKSLAASPDKSLIPEKRSYIQHRQLYDKQLQRAGVKHPHGLRHTYAQERYLRLTGWECPKRGGFTSRQLTTIQKEKDRHARLLISQELGHAREQITVVYLGR